MSWWFRLFGKSAKTIGLDDVTESQAGDDIYALAQRNRHLAARSVYLTEKLKKKNISGFSDFVLPEDVQSGSKEYLATLNENLDARVGYLENLLITR